MKHLSLFSGIGGFDLAAEMMGWENVAHCEIDKHCQAILKKHWPNAISYSDIYQVDFTKHYGSIDIISAGVPCQPFSLAGKQKGKDDDRYLWHEFIRCVRECGPKWVVAENVLGFLSNDSGWAHERVIESLEHEGYETLTLVLPANYTGTAHERKRVFIVGYSDLADYTDTDRGQLGEISDTGEAKRTQSGFELPFHPFGLSWYEAVCQLHGVHHGIPAKLDYHRNRMLGNAIVPQVVYDIFKSLPILSI